jgi:hypothetical protein
MAVKLVGTMKVRSINGRYGQFAVGELITDIGTFKVKDTTLDQYAEGEYRGEFIITRIFPNSYVMHSRVVTEVCATVSEIFLETAEEKVMPDNQAEPDPVDAAKQADGINGNDGNDAVPAVPAVPTDPIPPIPENPEKSLESVDPDAALFGELCSLVSAFQPVKLDPTIDRGLFRQQRDRLREIGYRFEAATQTWLPKERLLVKSSG